MNPLWLLVVLIALLGFLKYQGMLDQNFVFFPEPWDPQPWAELSQLPLEEVTFTSEDGTHLYGWYLPATDAELPPMLWCHGNAGNISHRLDNMMQLHARGIGFFIFDYRGYGRSEGVPSEKGLYADGLAALKVLQDKSKKSVDEIVVFGRSLGSAVATEIVKQNKSVAGLILETPFPSVKAVAKHHYANLPVDKLLQSKFELQSKLKDIECPLLVIHGTQDSIIPFELGKQVFDSANEPKRFYVIEGADHNNTYTVGGAIYFNELQTFLKQRIKS